MLHRRRMPLTFAHVQAAQQPQLIALWADSWSEVDAGIDFNARIPWFAGHMADWLAKGGLRLGAFDADGALLGFILHEPASGHLDQLCVRRDHKGRGLAHLLMAEAKRLSPAGMHLDVNAMNGRAIRFYEREGFVKTGEGINPTSGLPIFHYRWRP
jgi:putative acetyltransferase